MHEYDPQGEEDEVGPSRYSSYGGETVAQVSRGEAG